MTKEQKQIDELIKKKKFNNQKELLEEIYKVIHNVNPKFDNWREDFEAWRKKKESNFSKMKSVKRDFSPEFKYAISEISGVSFTRFLNGEEDFDPLSFKYAAFKNEREIYEKLFKAGGEDIFYETDEWGKYFLDYLAEYCDSVEKMEVPIRFLQESCLSVDSEKTESYLALLTAVIRLDDPDVFKWYKINYLGQEPKEFRFDPLSSVDSDELTNLLLDEILKSDKILTELLKPTYIPEKTVVNKEIKGNTTTGQHSSLNDPFELKNHLLARAFENNDMDSVEKIFTSFEREIYEQAKNFTSKNGTVSRKLLKKSHMGIHYLYDEYSPTYESSLIIKSELYNLDDDLDRSLGVYYADRYTKLDLDGIASLLTGNALSNMEDGEIIENHYEGKIYHKCEKNLAYDMLEKATEYDFERVPEYYGEENGVQIISHHSPINEYYYDLNELMEALSAFHDFSREALGDGKAYVYADYSERQLYRNKAGELSFCGWQLGAEIKTTEYALCEAIVSATNISRYDDDDDKREISRILYALNRYTHDTSLLVNLGDKLLKWIDDKVMKIDLSSRDGKREYMHLGYKKTLIGMYRDKLNGISAQNEEG